VKAKTRFWLDGGYDREQVEACRLHPEHDWWTFRLGDVLHPDLLHSRSEADELMTICRVCYVPRCGSTADSDRCLHPRHHKEWHHYRVGVPEPVGGLA
jgi:hypothetical protein